VAIALVLESGGRGFDSSVLLVFGDFAWRCGRARCGAVSGTRAGNLHAALWTRAVLSPFSPFPGAVFSFAWRLFFYACGAVVALAPFFFCMAPFFLLHAPCLSPVSAGVASVTS